MFIHKRDIMNFMISFTLFFCTWKEFMEKQENGKVACGR